MAQVLLEILFVGFTPMPQGYDMIILNSFLSGKNIYDFSYDDDTMGEIIKSSMQDLTFQGGLGTINFDTFGDPSINFEISYQKSK